MKLKRYYFWNCANPGKNSNRAQVSAVKHSSRGKPHYHSATQQNRHVLSRPCAAAQHKNRTMIMEGAQENELLQWLPKLREIVEEKKRQHDQENSRGCAAPPISKGRNEPGKATYGAIQEKEIQQDNQYSRELSALCRGKAKSAQPISQQAERKQRDS